MNLTEKEQIFGVYPDRNGNLRKVSLKFDKFMLSKLVQSEKEFMTPFLSYYVCGKHFIFDFAKEQPSNLESIFLKLLYKC